MFEDVRITTTDNPYDPFEDFDQWNAFDMAHGYNTCAYLARVMQTSEGLSDSLNNESIETAIDEICRINPTGKYKKVTLKQKKVS